MCRKALADEKRQHSGSHFAHFDFTRRVTHDGSARADILCHDAACADCRAFSNRYSGQDRCSSTEKNVVFDNDGSVDGLHVPKSAEVWWHRVITSYEKAVRPHSHVRPDRDVAAENTAFSDTTVWSDSCLSSDASSGVNIRRPVNGFAESHGAPYSEGLGSLAP